MNARARALAVCTAAAALAPRAARADDPPPRDGRDDRHDGTIAVKAAAAAAARGPGDTTYGRIAGDVSFVAGAGVTVAPHGVRAVGDLRVRYIETVGLFADYEEGGVGASMDPRRVVSGGVEIRPLFVARWLNGYEWASPRLDLAFDSIGIALGAFVAQPLGGAFAERPGFQLGLGVEAPIFERAAGPWIGLHGGARWSDVVLGGSPVGGPSDRSLFLSITLSWHAFVGAHVVDAGDRAPR